MEKGQRIMPMEPLITTVIPTYRRPKLLRRAIQSVLNQTYPHFLVQVFDNASGDETGEVVAEIMRRDPRVRYHCHKENIGLERNFAYGAAQVTTPWLNFLSDDDLLLPKFFETAMDAFERYQGAAIFLGTLICVNGGEAVWPSQVGSDESEFYEPPDGFFRWLRAPFTWTSCIFRREAVDNVGGLDASVGEPIDGDLTLRVASRYPVIFSKAFCALFFDGGASGRAKPSAATGGLVRKKETIANEAAFDQVTREKMVVGLEQYLARLAFRGGITGAARFGRLDDARDAAAILRGLRASAVKASIAHLFGSRSTAGSATRWAYRQARQMRSQARKLTAPRPDPRYEAMVIEALGTHARFESELPRTT